MPQPDTAYYVILKSVPEEHLDDVTTELMTLFNLERANAAEVASRAPITLISRLTRRQVSNVQTHTPPLLKLGVEIEITTEPLQGRPALSWPQLPYIATHPGNVFVCPGCGDRFLVSQLDLSTHPAAPVTHGPPPAEEPALAEAAPEEEEDVAVAEVVEEEPEPAKLEPTQGEVEPVPLAEDDADKGKAFRVSIRQKLKRSQKNEVAGLLAKFQDISEKQALKLANRPLITVLKSASKQEAEAVKKEFREIGINVRVSPAAKPRG